jgi:hypothetical protein
MRSSAAEKKKGNGGEPLPFEEAALGGRWEKAVSAAGRRPHRSDNFTTLNEIIAVTVNWCNKYLIFQEVEVNAG